MANYIYHLLKLNFLSKKYLSIIGLSILNVALNIHSMENQLKQLDPSRGQSNDKQIAFSQLQEALSTSNCPTTTLIQNCNNNYERSNTNDNRNTCNPVNNNIINFSFLGEGLSKLTDSEQYKILLNRIVNLSNTGINWIMNNKKVSIATLVGILYITLTSRLMYLHSKLSSSSCWSQWRSNLAIEELYVIPRHILYNDLLTNIQTKYTNFRNFRDSLAPLSNFLEDAEQEEAYIKHYEYIIKFLKMFRISGLVFYSNDLYKELSKRSSRLLFIKSAFLNWYADRKLSNPEKEILVRRFPRIKGILGTDHNNYTMNAKIIPPLLPEESIDHILENLIQI